MALDTKCAYPTAEFNEPPTKPSLSGPRESRGVGLCIMNPTPKFLQRDRQKVQPNETSSACPCCSWAIPTSRRIFEVAENPPAARSNESAAAGDRTWHLQPLPKRPLPPRRGVHPETGKRRSPAPRGAH